MCSKARRRSNPAARFCRGRTRRDRDVKMTAAVGVYERFYRLLAVTFSLFRHPPDGGCHLPPLGEGKDGCGFAGGDGLSLVPLPGRRDAAPYNETLRIRRNAFIQEAPAAGRLGRRSLRNFCKKTVPATHLIFQILVDSDFQFCYIIVKSICGGTWQ